MGCVPLKRCPLSIIISKDRVLWRCLRVTNHDACRVEAAEPPYLISHAFYPFLFFIMFLLPLWRLGRFGTLEEAQNNLGSHACMGNVDVGEMSRGLIRKEH